MAKGARQMRGLERVKKAIAVAGKKKV